MLVATIYANQWGSFSCIEQSEDVSLVREFSDIGLKVLNTFYEFKVIDEKKFFLSVIKYGITYESLCKHTYG
jgi:hypothetical protein